MKQTVSLVLVALLGWPLSVEAKARNDFDYLAFGVNKPSYDDLDFTPKLNEASLAPLKEEIGKEGVGFRAFYGYQLNPYVAIEAGANYYGKNDFTLFTEKTDNKGVVTKTTQHKGSFSGLGGDVRLVGTYALTNNLYVKGSVGALAWFSDKEFVTKETNKFVINEESESGVSLVTGLGLAYGIKKFVAVSIDAEKTEVAGVSVTNLGLSVTFRM